MGTIILRTLTDNSPVPLMFVSKAHDKVVDQHNDYVGDQGRQSHFRFSDATVALRGSGSDPVTEWTIGEEADYRSHQDGEVGIADTLGWKIVRRGGEVL